MEMFNGVSSRTNGNNIDPSLRYYGPSYPDNISAFIPEGAPFSNASVEIFKLGFGWKVPNARTHQELTDYSIDLTEIGDYLVFATSNNKFVFHKADIQRNGLGMNRDDMGIEEWIEATEGEHAIEYVSKPTGEMRLFEGPEFVPNYSEHSAMPDVNVPIADMSGVNMDINKVGEYFSRIANLEQDLRNLIFTDYPKNPGYNPETEAFFEFLMEKGLGPAREINGIGIENMEATARSRLNGTSLLSVSTEFYEKALAVAKAYGLDERDAVQFAKRSFLYHELSHDLIREKLSREAEEVKVGELLAEFFGNRAPLLEGKIAQYYGALAKENEAYADGWRGGIKSSAKSLMSKIESLVMQYASEAKDMKLDEEGARDYVESRLENDIKDLKESENPESDSAKDSKYEDAKTKTDTEDSGNESHDCEDSSEEADSEDGDSGGDE
ncbi:MAG: hypothetical protein QGI89_01735 [Candidatus Woesearchaeota archaeon]|nr:hypothetical protein [Candidatus Woesearchaeota archaeon]